MNEPVIACNQPVWLVNCPEAQQSALWAELQALGLTPQADPTAGPEPAVAVLWVDSPTGIDLETLSEKWLGRIGPAILTVGSKRGAAALLEADCRGADQHLVSADCAEIAAQSLLLAHARRRFAQSSPLTGLPGPGALESALQVRLPRRGELAVLAFDLDGFKGYNDKYGWHRGDAVLRWFAQVLLDELRDQAKPGWLLAHVGGDDFFAAIQPDEAESIARRVITVFTDNLTRFYDPEDSRIGHIMTLDRQGKTVVQPLMTLTVAGVTNSPDGIAHIGQVSAILAELKRFGKTLPGSNYVPDRRHTRTVPNANPTSVGL
jgi:diguanylate cyclase (GGDEF)-like protein